MTLSYRVIKNHQIDPQRDNFEIPVISTKEFLKYAENSTPAPIEQMENVQKAKIQKEELLTYAKTEAKNIVEKAHKQAQEIKNKAQETGYQEGFQRGQEEGYQIGQDQAFQEAKEIQEQAKQVLRGAHKQSREYIHSTREEITALATSMAESIIHFSIDTREEHIVEMVKSALHQAEERKQILFRCSAPSISILKVNTEEFQRICPNAKFTFLEDKGIKEHGCIIETEEQVMSLDIDEQLENIRTALLEMEENHEF